MKSTPGVKLVTDNKGLSKTRLEDRLQNLLIGYFAKKRCFKLKSMTTEVKINIKNTTRILTGG
jgi:hypothetical protein